MPSGGWALGLRVEGLCSSTVRRNQNRVPSVTTKCAREHLTQQIKASDINLAIVIQERYWSCQLLWKPPVLTPATPEDPAAYSLNPIPTPSSNLQHHRP